MYLEACSLTLQRPKLIGLLKTAHFPRIQNLYSDHSTLAEADPALASRNVGCQIGAFRVGSAIRDYTKTRLFNLRSTFEDVELVVLERAGFNLVPTELCHSLKFPTVFFLCSVFAAYIS